MKWRIGIEFNMPIDIEDRNALTPALRAHFERTFQPLTFKRKLPRVNLLKIFK